MNNNKKILEIINEIQARASDNYEKYNKLAPNGYGTGVELGEKLACIKIKEEIEELTK